MKIEQYTLKLTLRSPFLIPSTQIAKWGQDVSQMTDDDGHAMIPGDLVKGLMRHALQTIETHTDNQGLSVDLFGQAPDNPVERHQRGRVVVSDLTAVEKPDHKREAQDLYTRVRISRKTGAAEIGHLQFMGQLYPAGKAVLFTGTLTLLDSHKKDIDWLKKALAIIPAVGANKSSGYGEVLSAKLIEKENGVVSYKEVSQDHLTVRITFDRPVLINSEKLADNVFQSSEVIPGAVIKGALAAALDQSLHKDSTAYNDGLSQIRFGFAFPKYREAFHYPPLPFSLMISPDDQTGETLFDAASYSFENEPGPLLVGDEIPTQLQKAKKKVRNEAMKKLHRDFPSLPNEVRVRTSINGELNTAEDGSLFSYAMIKPKKKENRVEWYARIDRNEVNEAVFMDLMSSLQDGLPRVGKTEAWGKVEIVDPVKEKVQHLHPNLNLPTVSERKTIVLQLTTPALMIDPDAEETANQGLLAQYQQYWSEISSLKLLQIYTIEKLIGGFSAYTYRFRGGSEYYPYVLTEAGSTFVFENNGDNTKFSEWINSGLPLPEWVKKRVYIPEEGRIACPYVPENGYGTFILNPSDQLQLKSPQDVGVSHVW